jgi:TolB-like protein/tetratricopeptide (TPR) repeat protein/class 3 adenylate cyclase
MADEQKAKRLEIAHVLFMDIVGYSKLLTDEQSEALQELNQIVRSTEAAREAEAAQGLTILPTGDGMALVFGGSVEEPVECALQISRALRAQPSLPVRMGIHSGPIHHVKDANERENIAGVGINIAQRVMDCGDAGHILVSKRVADDLGQQRRWQPYLHELGDVEVKHGVVVSLVNLYAETIGNPNPPTRIGKVGGAPRSTTTATRKGLSPLARAIFIIVGLVIALIFVLAIVSVIFAPAIMRTLDRGRLAALPQPTATAVPSLADTIKSAVAKKITDELQGELSREKNAAVERPPPPAGSAIPEKSIAVLPFDNLSRDPDNAYFCEGVQDEILTRLAKVSDLKVVSRTSTQHFKSSPDNLPQIAKQLGAMHVLEGSVQKSNDQVRVNVQLINALTDAHLWAETFDRKLTDIFAVESEIAKTVADTLQAKLTGSEKTAISNRPTENPQAYELYLKGRFFWNKRTGNDLKTAANYFQRAIDADPSYANAYAGLAQSYLLMPLFGAGMPRDFFPKASDAARRAIELDETSAEGHAALGNLYCMDDFNPPAAEKEFQRAIALDPNYATAHHWFSNGLLVAMGRFDEAIKEGKRAVELDPLSLIINADLGSTLMLSRRYDDAIAQLRRTLALDPNFAYAHWNLGEALYLKGDSTGAIAEYEKAASLDNDPEIQALLARAYADTGKKEQALEILRKLSETAQHQFVRGYLFALIYIGLGDKTTAIQYLERCSAERENIDLNWIKVDPLLDPLRGNPRFEALLQKVIAPKSEPKP